MKLARENTIQAIRQAAVLVILAWLLFGLFLENVVLSGLVALACFFPVIGMILYYPKMEKKNYARKVEADLPFVLMNLAIELNLGVPFTEALKHSSKGEGYSAKELRKIIREIENQGASVEESLRHFSERIESTFVKRSVTQLAASFEQGSDGYTIKRIASEMLTRQRIESKLFSGKLVVLSLLFIAVSAIVPALFQSFSIVGSILLKMSFTPTQLFLIIVVVFPLLDLALLLYIKNKTPVFLRSQ